MTEFAIGIDIGGTNTAIAAVGNTGHILQQITVATQSHPDFDAFFRALCTAIDALQHHGQLIGIGLGAPAGNRFDGSITAPANVAWQGSIPIGTMLAEKYPTTVVIDNDANAAAIGEMQYGAAQGLQNFILITLGTGLGSGIVIDGQLRYGAHGYAGELGHISINPQGRHCGCGRKGCLETYVSANGLRRTLAELIAQTNRPSPLRNQKFDEITALEIAQAAENGDTLAQEVFDYTGQILGNALANWAAFSDPEAYILFGGLAKSGQLLLAPSQKSFTENLLFLYRDKVALKLSDLNEQNAGVLGSAALAWKEKTDKM
ncbi:MAG: hypothetical protein RIS47_131 [Bacteroidota bacterium]